MPTLTGNKRSATLIDPIRPTARTVRGRSGDRLTNVIKANVRECVKRLEGLDPILSKLVHSAKLQIIGGIYELRTGRVSMIQLTRVESSVDAGLGLLMTSRLLWQ